MQIYPQYQLSSADIVDRSGTVVDRDLHVPSDEV
jgi:hypothetical protein